MNFNSEKEAKSYALSATTKHASESDLLRRISECKRYQELFSDDLEQKNYWLKIEKECTEYLNSEKFKLGQYHSGIDELLLELIEIRALMYSFENVEVQSNPFQAYKLHSQWLSGNTYKIFAIYGKLLNSHKSDKSLKNVWCNVNNYLQIENFTTKEEVSQITEFIMGLKNNTSNVMKYRNKAIAHNEQQPNVQWSDVDRDLKGLCRAWSLITMWTSIGIMSPFDDNQVAFSGFEPVLTKQELASLKVARTEFLKQVRQWCTWNFVTGNLESERAPFAEISLRIKA
ncbi:hypothetical protein AB733_24185 [Photobacterium swingsii]|uniref:HEPN AbiU2-like domain-containing protein n=1 Tax=Photobacterium swingsii TaxID=680026 RepID=A0A0J8V6N4_9GAMM|nr:hypothetical protein [Photobacterium swingsii]KMV28365.1 hypothetical protein AB733_24185 [Photobacterium swingsii]PSW18665.1 hypothetical protein C9I94_24370 [Photobacterium swingsii]